jgi:nucleotide-binding universal stress UspA family protein
MKVLLAVDSSKSSYVVESAATRPWPSDTTFHLLSVVDLRHWEGLPVLIEDAKHEAEAVIKDANNKLSKSGYSVTSDIPQGNPKEIIPDYAKRWNADLIMLGSHRSNVATRFLLGSVAQSVFHTAACSVEIVREHSGKPSQGSQILLATDGSPYSTKAVTAIANRPWPPKSEVRVLSVVQLLTADVPSLASSMRSPTPNVVDEVCRIARSRADRAVAAAQKTLAESGLSVHAETPIGEPRAVILDQAKEWNADLIIVGSHGRHGLERFLLGSVAEFVAAYATCSVVVVR